MTEPREFNSILSTRSSVRDAARELEDLLLANVIMIGEVPAPTFAQEERPPMIEIPAYRRRSTGEP